MSTANTQHSCKQHSCEQKVLPLAGKRILVTRPGEQGTDFANALLKLGAQPILIPLIEISEPDSWHELDSSIAKLDEYHWLLFASSNAVSAFAKRLKKNLPLSTTSIKLPNIAVIGDKTARVVSDWGFKVNYSPPIFLAEDFVANFPGYPSNLRNIKMLWPRVNNGRDFIAKELNAVGAQVHIVEAYKTGLPKHAIELGNQLWTLISNKKIDAITLASNQTAINLAKIMQAKTMASHLSAENNAMPENNLIAENNATESTFISRNSLLPSVGTQEARGGLKNSLQDVLIVTIGPETSAGALNYLGKVDKEASPHSAEGIINALIELFQ